MEVNANDLELGPNPSEDIFEDLNADDVYRVAYQRSGHVLGKGTILKVDHYDNLPRLNKKQILLSGAPNFRKACMNVYGCGQPSEFGIYTVINHIKKGESSYSILWINMREEPIVYINNRPFVLREIDHAMINMSSYAGVNSQSIEEMEFRLKSDILKECTMFDNNILVHDEIDNQIVPCWEAVNAKSVQTPREVYHHLLSEGFKIVYMRVPVTPEQPLKENHFDTLVSLLMQIISSDSDTHIVYNCQMGVGRSTVGMVLAILIKLKKDDNEQLRLTLIKKRKRREDRIMQDSTIDTSTQMLKDGEYRPIQSLLRLFDHGKVIKAELDAVIDECGHTVNLREAIHDMKVKYETSLGAPEIYKARAISYLERYFFLLLFNAYLYDVMCVTTVDPDETDAVTVCKLQKDVKSFAEWVKARPEVTSILEHMRSSTHYAFQSNFTDRLRRTENSLQILNVRTGTVLAPSTMLKADTHMTKIPTSVAKPDSVDIISIPGAPNFRKVRDLPLFALASPTATGLKGVLNHIELNYGKSIAWVNLREEPYIYINGTPFVLRDTNHAFQNLRVYTNIAAERLEEMEQRLKKEAWKEATHFLGKILVHDETAQHELVSNWEPVSDYESIRTMKDLFNLASPATSPIALQFSDESEQKKKPNTKITYSRLPLTIGKCPTEQDFDKLLNLLGRIDAEYVVFNCQMGRGRSTVGLVIWHLLHLWKDKHGVAVLNPVKRNYEYPTILNLVRVIPDGQFIRQQVDHCIDTCGSFYNIREKLDELRTKLQESRTQEEITVHRGRVVSVIETYFWIIVVNSYLAQYYGSGLTPRPPEPGSAENRMFLFLEYLNARPEIRTLVEELRSDPDSALVSVADRLSSQGELNHDKSDTNVTNIILARKGNVLVHGSIVKSDHFPGCQRMSLLPHITGAPNYRQAASDMMIYGVAIPTIEGMQNVLNFLGSKPHSSHKVIWISLREEPVIYVNNRPFVLRSFDNLFANFEYTGIDTKRVEQMEERLKKDILEEAKQYNDKFLVHDESPDGKLLFNFESVSKETVLTPRDAYNSLGKLGYPVSYARIAITDEQAPEETDFDDIVALVKSVDVETTKIIFNCQMGRGRTTTGMVIATLLSKCHRGEFMSLFRPQSSGATPKVPINNAAPTPGAQKMSPVSSPPASGSANSLSPSLRASGASDEQLIQYSKGEYRVILRLIRVLKNGTEIKDILDDVIDHCSHIQNLRQDILTYREKATQCENAKLREAAQKRGINYLKRYFYLIAFTAYVTEQQPLNSYDRFKEKFHGWMQARKELHTLLENIDLN